MITELEEKLVRECQDKDARIKDLKEERDRLRESADAVKECAITDHDSCPFCNCDLSSSDNTHTPGCPIGGMIRALAGEGDGRG